MHDPVEDLPGTGTPESLVLLLSHHTPPRTRPTQPRRRIDPAGSHPQLTNYLDVQGGLVLGSVDLHGELILARVAALGLADVEDRVLSRVADVDAVGVQGLSSLGPAHLRLWLSLEQQAGQEPLGHMVPAEPP